MKNTTSHLSMAAIALACALPVAATAQDDSDGYMLTMHAVNAKIGHIPEFIAGMEAYSDCLEENEAEGGYSVWRSFDGDRTRFEIVSRFDTWGEFDEDDEAGDACWGNEEIRAGVFDHMSSWKTRYARKMVDWSGDSENYTVVHLHNFRVSDGSDFRALVGEMMGYMAEAEYPYQPDWFNVMATGYGAPDFFAVSHFEDFAAMDEERAGLMGVLRDAVGEERAEQMWEDWGDTMADEKGYWRETLVIQPDMGYMPGD